MKLGKSDHTETKRIELLRNIRTMFMLSNATPKIEKLQGIFNSFEQEIQKKNLDTIKGSIISVNILIK